MRQTEFDLSQVWLYVLWVAKERLKTNKTIRHEARYGPQIEDLGAAGELAARRYLGLPEKLHTGFDQGRDLIWRQRIINVKATHLTKYIDYRHLQWPHYNKILCDIAIMTGVDLERKRAKVMGYATAAEIEKAEWNYNRDTVCREIKMTDLHPIEELFTAKELYHRMAAPKPKRIVDPELVELLREEQGLCLVGLNGEFGFCSDPGIDMHHIGSRGSGGDDVRGNLIRLCRHHHQMVHNGNISRQTLYAYLERGVSDPSVWSVIGGATLRDSRRRGVRQARLMDTVTIQPILTNKVHY